MKLIGKTRIGGKLHRKYDTPRTPYQRLLESDQITDAAKNKWITTYMHRYVRLCPLVFFIQKHITLAQSQYGQ